MNTTTDEKSVAFVLSIISSDHIKSIIKKAFILMTVINRNILNQAYSFIINKITKSLKNFCNENKLKRKFKGPYVNQEQLYYTRIY